MTRFMAKTGASDQKKTIVGTYDSAREAWDALADNAKDREDGNPNGFSAEVNMLEALARGEYEDFLLSRGIDDETGTPILVSGMPDEEDGIGILPGNNSRWYEVTRERERESITLGTVSSGSLKTDDMLRAFWRAIPGDAQVVLFNDSEHGDLVTAYSADTLFGEDNEEALLTVLTDALEALAPEGYYFGAHPGDGADFGFWPEPEEPSWEPKVVFPADPSKDKFMEAAAYAWGAKDYAPDSTVAGVRIEMEQVQGFALAYQEAYQKMREGKSVSIPAMHDAFENYLTHGSIARR